MNKPVKQITVPTWIEDQKKPRLICCIEPEPDELRDWPFLQGLGGILTKYRHPWLVWFCNCFVSYKISAREKARLLKVANDMRDETEANKENWTKDQIARRNSEMCSLVSMITSYDMQEKDCKRSLDELKNGEFKDDNLLMEDICSGGKYFNLTQEACDAMIRMMERENTKHGI